MKLVLIVLAVCAGGKATIQSSKLMNFGYYWRDWDINTTVPDDAVAGGVDTDGHTTYVARSVFNRQGVIVPGKASSHAKNMWLESQLLEMTTTKDIEILCVLNERRIKWVVAKNGETVDKVVGDNVLIFGGSYDADHYAAIGRHIIGKEIVLGRIVVWRGKFGGIALCRNGKCWWVRHSYEVLVYVED